MSLKSIKFNIVVVKANEYTSVRKLSRVRVP